MKIKGALMMGAMLLASGTFNSAKAADVISVYETNKFIVQLANAINNPDPSVGRSFLQRNVDSATVFSNTVNRPGYVDPRVAGYHNVWWNPQVASYYRYPGHPGAYYAPVNFQAAGKNEMIAQFESKKNLIPNYHQQITVQGTRMPADASSIVVDVTLAEYGIGYVNPYYYGGAYANKIQHSTASCQLHLQKEQGVIMMTRMACNTLLTG